MRPSVDQIQQHAFFTAGDNSLIPDQLPESTLQVAPTEDMIAKLKESIREKQAYRTLQHRTIGLFTMGTTIMGKTHHGASVLESPFEQQAPILVQRWVDYTDKYGIGYKLTNGEVGALFNDQTSIRYCSDKNFSYFDPHQAKANLTGTYLNQDHPKPLDKKYKLLKRFKNFLYQ